MDEKRKSPWLLWAAAVLFLVLIVYPLSIGPETYIFWRYIPTGTPADDWWRAMDATVYAPIYWLIENGPEWLTHPLKMYQMWFYSLATS